MLCVHTYKQEVSGCAAVLHHCFVLSNRVLDLSLLISNTHHTLLFLFLAVFVSFPPLNHSSVTDLCLSSSLLLRGSLGRAAQYLLIYKQDEFTSQETFKHIL